MIGEQKKKWKKAIKGGNSPTSLDMGKQIQLLNTTTILLENLLVEIFSFDAYY